MSLRVGETGKIIRINTNFDLSGNTDLGIEFTKSDATTVTKTSLDGVIAPGVDAIEYEADGVTVKQTFEANKYLEYPFEAGVLTVSGPWTAEAQYTDATPKFFIGLTSDEFTVYP